MIARTSAAVSLSKGSLTLFYRFDEIPRHLVGMRNDYRAESLAISAIKSRQDARYRQASCRRLWLAA
jgi:hypothetical protein